MSGNDTTREGDHEVILRLDNVTRVHGTDGTADSGTQMVSNALKGGTR